MPGFLLGHLLGHRANDPAETRLEPQARIWHIGRTRHAVQANAQSEKGRTAWHRARRQLRRSGAISFGTSSKPISMPGRAKAVVTRFPPEPNGYLHIGHAKSICLNFGIAEEFGGRCHLRFDDTNPAREEQEYIDAIERDVRWLGFDWGKHLYHASDYFEQLYAWAEDLIRAGKAYVDDQNPEQMRVNRGTLTEPGKNSPFRDRSVDENLDLFRRMRAGEFPNGARVCAPRSTCHPATSTCATR